MHAQHRAAEAQLGEEIAVARGVDAVAGDLREAQKLGGASPVQREGRPGHRPAAQRTDVHPFAGVDQPLGVAVEHLDVRQQHVSGEHRLGALKVCIGGHDDASLPLGQRYERLLQRLDALDQFVHGVARPQTQVQRDLVVAAAPGVQLGARVAGAVDERPLDDHVDVLELDGRLQRARLEIVADRQEPLANLAQLLVTEDVLLAEHSGVGEGADDVVAP